MFDINEKIIAILDESDISVSKRYRQDGEYYGKVCVPLP